jgi:uncharacterized protein YndB with AHSA1/START domain
MTTTMSAEAIENLMLRITQEIRVHASLDVTFDALLEQLGPLSERPDGTSMQMKLEPWPGGRWFRDLGGNDGHYWATVQAIKRNSLLELRGPLMMSQPVVNHVIYRLTQEGEETIIKFAHTAFGPIQPEHREGVNKGWTHIHQKVRERAERK